MANLSRTTRDHEEIRRWAEERGGKPAHVKRTGSQEDIGVLRIEFPGFGGDENLEPISWEDFFDKFDERDLALVYQEETAAGERSNFNKLISAETAAESGGRGRAGRSRGSRSSTAKKASKTAKKGAAAKSSKKTTAKKATTKKSTGKKATSKKRTTKKTASRRSTGRGAARKKSSGRRTAAKKRR